jgi:DNA-binding transcriptional MerR regulator
MLKISEVASRAGVSTDTVRYYEKQDLVRPEKRSEGGYRLYPENAIRRLRFIKQAQHCGFSLTEIAELLKLQDKPEARCDDVCDRAVIKKLELERKIRALQAMSVALNELIEVCQVQKSKPLDVCPIVAALEAGLATPGAAEEAR